MNVKDLARRTTRAFYSLTDVAVWIGFVALIVSILIVCIDVGGRYLLNSPLKGGYEILTLVLIIMVGAAILYTTLHRGHVGVDLLVVTLPRRMRIVVGMVGSVLGFLSWGILAYYTFLRSAQAFAIDERTPSLLRLPVAPFYLVLAITTFLCSLAYLMEVFHPVDPAEESGGIPESEL
jgi:TRAP-type C4-dicarboxylate transport system permease small subunit